MKDDYSYGPILESYYRRRFLLFFFFFWSIKLQCYCMTICSSFSLGESEKKTRSRMVSFTNKTIQTPEA